MNDTVPPARQLELALDLITDAERHVYHALLYHLSDAELGRAGAYVKQVHRDRFPS